MDSIKTPEVVDAKFCWLHNMYPLLPRPLDGNLLAPWMSCTQSALQDGLKKIEREYSICPSLRWIEPLSIKLYFLNDLETYSWFFLYVFPHIGLSSYQETSIHVLDYYATHTCPVYSACSKSIWWGIHLFSFFWKLGSDFILFRGNNVWVQALDEKSNYF